MVRYSDSKSVVFLPAVYAERRMRSVGHVVIFVKRRSGY